LGAPRSPNELSPQKLFMIRKSFVMKLNRGAEAEYRHLHSPIWEELAEVLQTYGVHNYSITLHPETGQLFAYAEIVDETRWKAIAQTPACRRWWDDMAEFKQILDAFAECFRQGNCRRELPNAKGALAAMSQAVERIGQSQILLNPGLEAAVRTVDVVDRY
jgi:L-rhamnose mutarotase